MLQTTFLLKLFGHTTHKLECVKYEVEVSFIFLCLFFGNMFKSFVHLKYWDILPIGLKSFWQIVMHERPSK